MRVRTSTPSLTGPSESTGVESHWANGACAGNRVDQAIRAGAERVAAAGVLGQLEAAARERMQAQDADGARIVDEAAGDAFELGREHVALLGVQAELVDALLDRLRIEGRERRESRRADRADAAARSQPARRSGSRRARAIA